MLIKGHQLVSGTNVAVSLNDTVPGTLSDKIEAGANISFTIVNEGGNERIQISGSASGGSVSGSLANVVTQSFTIPEPTFWEISANSLPAPRRSGHHFSVSGTLYIIGGLDVANAVVDTIWSASINDPTSWSDTGATLPAARVASAHFVVNDKAYLVGGQNASSVNQNTIYSASLSDMLTWNDTGATLPTAFSSRMQHFIIGEHAYIVGPADGVSNNKLFSASINNMLDWSEVTTLPVDIGLSTGWIKGEWVYVHDTATTNFIYANINEFPLVTWKTRAATMPYTPTYIGISYVNSRGTYIVGGYASPNPQTSVWFDPSEIPTGFTNIASLPEASFSLTSHLFSVSGTLYLVGGMATTVAVDTIMMTSSSILVDSIVDASLLNEKTRIPAKRTGQYSNNIPEFVEPNDRTNVVPWIIAGNPDKIETTVTAVAATGSTSSPTVVTQSITFTDPLTWVTSANTLPISIVAGHEFNVSGTLYIVGGRDNTTTYLTTILSASVNDPTSWSLASSGTLPYGVSWGQQFVVGNKAYIIGGLTAAGRTNAIITASLSNMLDWGTAPGTIPVAGYPGRNSGFIIDDVAYIMGINDSFTGSQALYSSNTSDMMNWVETPDVFLDSGYDKACWIINDRIHYFTNHPAGAAADDIYVANVYDLTNWQTWSAVLPADIRLARVYVTNDGAYIFGSYGVTLQATSFFSPRNNQRQWYQIANFPAINTGWYNHLFSVSGSIYIVGGVDTTPTNKIWYTVNSSSVGTTAIDAQNVPVNKNVPAFYASGEQTVWTSYDRAGVFPWSIK